MEALSVVNAPEVDDQVDEADSARDNESPAHPFGHGEPHGQRDDQEEQGSEAGRPYGAGGLGVGGVCLVLHKSTSGHNSCAVDDSPGRLPAAELAEFRLQLLALASLPSLSSIGNPFPFSGRRAEYVGAEVVAGYAELRFNRPRKTRGDWTATGHPLIDKGGRSPDAPAKLGLAASALANGFYGVHARTIASLMTPVNSFANRLERACPIASLYA